MNRTALLASWLSQSTISGTASALSFSGPTLFSYSSPIAALSGRTVQMIRPSQGSKTTTLHIGAARRAAIAAGFAVVEAPSGGGAW